MMDNKPIITVIMGTYNPSKNMIINAVNSIINQTFRNWEMIIYNDGSNPVISNEIEKLGIIDSRIFVINNENNKGLGYGLNRCIDLSRGEYIARMDDDDISEPNRFEIQKDFLDRNKEYEWVGSLAYLYDNSGIWGMAERPEKPKRIDFIHSSPFIHPSVMIRKDVLISINGYSERRITRKCEDYDLFMRLYSNGYKGYNIQLPLLKYNEDRKLLKRTWRDSLNEAIVRCFGFNEMGVLSIKTAPHIIKPMLVRLAAYMPGISQHIRTTNRSRGIGDKRI